MKKLLSVVLALMLLLTAVCALADTVETANEDGTVTVTTDEGVTFTYSKEDFEVNIDENGRINGKYLEETPEAVGFTVEVLKDTDAETHMAELAASYGTEVTGGTAFDEDETVEWLSTEYADVGETYTTTITVYARGFEGGCYVVTVYNYYENDVDADAEASDEDEELGGFVVLEKLLDSLSFAK